MKILNIILALGTALAASAGSARAVAPFTETFDTNASNWLNGISTAPTYNATGGIEDSGYISYTSTFTSGTGSFGGDPLQILFRGNNSANASADAFVGNWIADDIISLSLSIRHDYSTTLNLYARLDAGSGAAASLANSALYAIAPNTWTTITIEIENSNPPFTSYGAGSYDGIFSNIQNLQFGLYVPANTTFTNLTVDIDNVSVVPEPHEYALGIAGLLAVVIFARRRRQASAIA
jgi:hypothetical protein